MNALRQALVDYLAMRRALGYKLARTEKLLAQFLSYLEDRGECQLTTRAAVAWATLPAGAHRSWSPPDSPSFAALRVICAESIPQPRFHRQSCCHGKNAGRRRTFIRGRKLSP